MLIMLEKKVAARMVEIIQTTAGLVQQDELEKQPKLAKILDAQFTDEKTAIEGEISSLRQQLDGINAQIKELGFVGNISRDFLDRHLALKAEIDALKNQNRHSLRRMSYRRQRRMLTQY